MNFNNCNTFSIISQEIPSKYILSAEIPQLKDHPKIIDSNGIAYHLNWLRTDQQISRFGCFILKIKLICAAIFRASGNLSARLWRLEVENGYRVKLLYIKKENASVPTQPADFPNPIDQIQISSRDKEDGDHRLPVKPIIDRPFEYMDIAVSWGERNPSVPTIVEPKCSRWRPRCFSRTQEWSKMRLNAIRSIAEHAWRQEDPTYITVDELKAQKKSLLVDHTPKENEPSCIKAMVSIESKKGARPSMEDAHFTAQLKTKDQRLLLAGVCDGHGGANVSKYVGEEFPKRFPAKLEKTSGHVLQAFEELISELHQEVFAKPEWMEEGTTFVATLVDQIKHVVYTATLGDSEATIYRNIQGRTRAIPLSCVRDWGSKNDALRHAIVTGDNSVADPRVIEIYNTKRIRYASSYASTNISRSIGDRMFAGSKDKPAIIQKPKIAVNPVQRGDWIILACDGLADFVSAKEIARTLDRCEDKVTTAAKNLVDLSLRKQVFGNDNVTVIALKIW